MVVPSAIIWFGDFKNSLCERRSVPSKKPAVSILSKYLTGKVHEFHVHKVSPGDPYGWYLISSTSYLTADSKSISGSVQRSSPRTTKGPRTRPDRTDLGPDCSPGPTLVLSGPVLVLKIFWDVKDRSWTSPDRS